MPDYRFQIKQLKDVLAGLGSPHLKIPVISVAGTNGKGSVSTLIQNILTASGKKTGLYTSPHIFDFTERISIDGNSISKEIFKDISEKIKSIEKIKNCNLSEFELMTAVAIEYFFRENCIFNVMEVGLGGSLDATNVCENKLVSVITPISIEHTEYLGDSIEDISREKAGIIKSEGILIDSSETSIIRELGLKNNCDIYSKDIEYYIGEVNSLKNGRYSFSYFCEDFCMENIMAGMRGIHQCCNVSAAITAVRNVCEVNDNIVRDSIKNTILPGRLEIFNLNGNRKLIVDAAHNPAGFEVVKNFIEEWKSDRTKIYLIMGVYKDKDYSSMSKLIDGMIEKVYAFTPEDKRALDAVELVRVFKTEKKVCYDFNAAFNEAMNEMREGDWLLACGSFSVVRQALTMVSGVNKEYDEL